MNLLEGKVSSVEVKGPFQGKFGDYFSQSITLDSGQKFSKTSKTNEALVSEGSSVKILYNSKTTDKGTFHNIEQIEVISGSTGSSVSTSTETKSSSSKPEIKSQTLVAKSTDSSPTSKDLAIARMNAVTSAIALLGEGTSLDKVTELADQILEYTMQLQGKSSLKGSK